MFYEQRTKKVIHCDLSMIPAIFHHDFFTALTMDIIDPTF